MVKSILAFPERDTSKPAEQQGVFRKFEVRRVDGSDQPGGKHHGCRYFVIDMDHDAFAPAALLPYADKCAATHPELAADLRKGFAASRRPIGWLWRGAGTSLNWKFSEDLDMITEMQARGGYDVKPVYE